MAFQAPFFTYDGYERQNKAHYGRSAYDPTGVC